MSAAPEYKAPVVQRTMSSNSSDTGGCKWFAVKHGLAVPCTLNRYPLRVHHLKNRAHVTLPSVVLRTDAESSSDYTCGYPTPLRDV